jgi:C4-dicarboxylate-specific signal transduction histidine kinase
LLASFTLPKFIQYEVSKCLSSLRTARNELAMRVAERTAELRRTEAYLPEAFTAAQRAATAGREAITQEVKAVFTCQV